jgi:hypothetical protein
LVCFADNHSYLLQNYQTIIQYKMKTYKLTYEMYGTPCCQETTSLETFMQKLEEVYDRAEVPNSSISFQAVEQPIGTPEYHEYLIEMAKNFEK